MEVLRAINDILQPITLILVIIVLIKLSKLRRLKNVHFKFVVNYNIYNNENQG